MNIGYEQVMLWLNMRDKGMSSEAAVAFIKEKFKLPQKPQTLERQLRRLNASLFPEIHDIPDYRPYIPQDVFLKFEPTAIFADIHSPNYHREAFREALLLSKKRGIKRVICLGDTIDNEWCSVYFDVAKRSGIDAVSTIIETNYIMLKGMAAVFDEIVIVRGNHDERLLKMLNLNLSMADMYKMFSISTRKGQPNIYDKLNIIEKYHVYMKDSPTGDWLLAHQKNFSSVRGKIAQDLATIHEINVVTSHIHDLAITTSRNKHRYYAVAPGCLADESKMSYKTMRVSTYSPWILGWAIINEQGIPEVFHYSKEYGKD